MLEYKFRDLVGHTILEEIRRVRVQRVKQLLTDTDLAMPAIARRSGFSTPQRMSVVFRQVTGLTPSAYRQQAEVRDHSRRWPTPRRKGPGSLQVGPRGGTMTPNPDGWGGSCTAAPGIKATQGRQYNCHPNI